MAISITHAFVSGKADPPDTSLIKPSNWNAPHTLSMGTGKLVGRTTAATGAAEEIAVSGALTFSAQTLSLPTDAITNAYLANMATQTIKGRATAATGDPEDLTVAQVTAMLNTFTTSLKGLVPASGGGTTNFLRADGTFAAPPSADAQTILNTISTTRGAILFRNATVWTPLTPNTAGYVLREGGSGADPSWVGGVTRLNGGVVSGAATLDISLSSGYSRYILLLDDVVPVTNNNGLGLRFSFDSGSTYKSAASDYFWAYSYWNTAAAGGGFDSGTGGGPTTHINMSASTTGLSNTAGLINSYIAEIYPGAASKRASVFVRAFNNGTSVTVHSHGAGGSIYNGPLTNVRLFFTAGGNISTCAWALYGVS